MQQASLNVVTTPPHKLDTDTSLLPYPPPSEHLHGSTEYMGTTALTAVVDAEADVVHVINVADCRAVAGWYSPLTGKWRAQVLNREHSPMDPDEEAR
jgi:pyruvate dehydrogenase phosphatase